MSVLFHAKLNISFNSPNKGKICRSPANATVNLHETVKIVCPNVFAILV